MSELDFDISSVLSGESNTTINSSKLARGSQSITHRPNRATKDKKKNLSDTHRPNKNIEIPKLTKIKRDKWKKLPRNTHIRYKFQSWKNKTDYDIKSAFIKGFEKSKYGDKLVVKSGSKIYKVNFKNIKFIYIYTRDYMLLYNKKPAGEYLTLNKLHNMIKNIKQNKPKPKPKSKLK